MAPGHVTKPPKDEPVWIRPLCGALAAMSAETATNPVEIAKVRLQMMDRAAKSATIGVANATPQPRANMITVLSSVVKQDGPMALFRGLNAAFLRQVRTK